MFSWGSDQKRPSLWTPRLLGKLLVRVLKLLLWSRFQLKFAVVVEKDEDGYYVASVPELPGCHTQAKTLDELTKRVVEAIEAYLEAEGTVPREGVELVGIQFVDV